MEMKIGSKDFRVREGDEVNLRKWPTRVNSVYKSKAQCKASLEKHVAQLSEMQQLHYGASPEDDGLRNLIRKSHAINRPPAANTMSPGMRIHCQKRVVL